MMEAANEAALEWWCRTAGDLAMTARGSRPGQAAQNADSQLPSREQREREYESGTGGSERGGYVSGASTPSGSLSNSPTKATSDINRDGKVGDPLPLLLLGLAAIPIAAIIIAVLWFYGR